VESEWLGIVEESVPFETKEETSNPQPSEKKKWRYACRLFETNSLTEGAMRHVDLLLRNNHEISNYTTAITRQRPVNSNRERCFLCGPRRDVISRTSHWSQ
jgi:hypothetical protein